MIKKFILGLFTGFIGLISFSYGASCLSDLSYCNDVQFGDYFSSIGYVGSVIDNNFNFRNYYFSFNSGGTNYFSMWWQNDSAGYTKQGFGRTPSHGQFGSYFVCSSMPQSSQKILNGVSFCSPVQGFSDIQNRLTNTNRYLYNCTSNLNSGPITCYVCLYNSNGGDYICLDPNYGAYNYANGMYSETEIRALAVNNPFSKNSGSIGGSTNSGGTYIPDSVILGSDQSAINYYEKTYNWDQSICYAGVNSLSYVYGQNGVSFRKGYGLSIFDVYSGLYGNQDLDKMYVWLNSWIGNYELWYGVSGSPGNSSSVGNPPYLMSYNSGTNQVDIYYDNLTFPFVNQPLAIYFLANNIVDNSPYSTMGSSIISYCNLKINSGSYDQIIDQSDKNNINGYTEQYNTNYGYNPDGSQKEYTGAWLSSGVSLAFSGKTSIKNTLQNFFDQFDGVMSIADVNSPNKILPDWIVGAFMFVILFKFLRKR